MNLKPVAYTWLPDKHPYLSDGPWINEPDAMHFIYNDMHIFIQRFGATGTLNGYVGYDSTYPLDDAFALTVHGDITWDKDYLPDSDLFSIFKVDIPYDPHWLGFDTAHGFDLKPCLELSPGISDLSTYKDINYVISEAISLSNQLADLFVNYD